MKRNIYFVGIGGIGMSAIARYFLHEGRRVAGYDRTPSPLTEALAKEGAEIHYEDDVRLIGEAWRNPEQTLVVYTPAVPADHSELTYFREGGFEVVKRSEILGHLTAGKRTTAIAGTHGKTTTTSMVTHILMEAQWDPTVMIGGYLPLLHASHRVGHGDTIVLESCEYCDSFLNFFPTLAVILNVEADHLDYFKDLEHIKRSYRSFAEIALQYNDSYNETIVSFANNPFEEYVGETPVP